ncbi:MAG: hypothetical protein IT422_21525 [Pirellulaceae bacterium]|nr:hypothetical protein [Pirellulaceae bacterium]
MNVHSALQPLRPLISRLPSIRWLVPLVCLPLAAFAIYGAWLGYREYQASRELEALIAPIRAAGEPLGDAWLEQHFRQTASSEGTAAWSELLVLSTSFGWNATTDLPIVGNGKSLRTLEVGAKWEADALVDDFLEQAQPLFDSIYDTAKYPTPVWQPMDFQGIGTLLPELQDTRQIQRLLQLDFEHAIVHSDSDRALRDLQAMQTTADAFDWDMFLVGELVNIALRNIYYGSIQRSLFADVWSADQLEQLMAQVGQPLPLAQSWNASIESEKAMALSYVSGSEPPQPVGLLLSAASKLDLMRKYAEVQSLSEVPLGQLTRSAAELERIWGSELSHVRVDTLSSTLLPAVVGYANAFERWERNRRLVLTSLSVKRFQLANNRWPENLQELTQVGLSPEDWTLPGIGSLGYSIEPDGKTACVWAVGEKDIDVASQCPDYAGEKLEQVQYYLTLIK